MDALGEKYRASDSVKKRAELSTQIRDLQVQLQDELSKGAKPCPDGADHRVIGMLKRPTYYDSDRDMQMPEIWEVGCIVCPPVLVEDSDGTELNGKKVKRWSHSARGATPKEAVEKWNAGKWLKDAKIALNVPSQEIFKL